MKGRIVFATGNAHKMTEIREILQLPKFEVYSMGELGIPLDIEENGSSFAENAMLKAQALAQRLPNDIVLADDSGLEVDYLHKAPGIYSARFAGKDTPAAVKNELILQKLEGVPAEKRSARFVCAIAAIFPNQTKETVEGVMEGQIGEQALGEHGFGYDPIFYLPALACSAAQLSPEQKNAISHRGQALRKMREKIEKFGENARE